MHVLLWSLALLLTTSSISSPANADDRTDCFAIGRTDYDNAALFDTRIKACTRYISRAQGKHRAEGYSSRGSWYTKKGNYDQALADFDRALAIDAMNVEFYDYKADVLLFEEGRVRPLLPTVESDLPGGARRLVQKAEGIRATIVNGAVTLENGEPTGNYTGEVLKGRLAS